MSISKNFKDLEKNSYTEVIDSGNPEVAQRVKVTGLGSLLEGINYDSIVASYPTSSQEVYTYKSGGISGTTVATITVNYTNSSKTVLLNVSKS